MGKGDTPRRCQTSQEEEELRWKLFEGAITFIEFEKRYAKLKREGKIYRR